MQGLAELAECAVSAGQPDTATGPGGASTSLGGSSMAQAGNAGAVTMAGQGGNGPPTTSPVGGSAGDCIVTKSRRITRGRPEFSYEYIRIRYDAATRIQTSEYSSKPDFSALTFVRQTLYDESGHVLATIGSESNSRTDYTYDSAGNETSWGSSRTTSRDLTEPPQPPFLISRESTHTYDGLGRLSTSTDVAATTNYTYSHDEAGRCAVITSNNGDGTPDETQTYGYATDGTITIVSLNFLTDTPNDGIRRDGWLVSLGRGEFVITPQCASMPVSMHKLEGNACRYPMLRWTESIIYSSMVAVRRDAALALLVAGWRPKWGQPSCPC